ncbi:OmpW/AlkL family protein [Ideonella sp. BN130291]|uniref:OmpW/AlkL family protein n=1 Tax=Ideonella sp. BN130291 TaxID=3112940 RepID=UPI002E255FB8|nr:OmpW family outer membrane protein [Ideonella sp. BN130291]
MKNLLSAAAAALLSLGAAGASAQSNTVYVGGAYIDVHSRAPALSGGQALPAPGAQIEVDDASTVGFGYTYRFTPAWSVEAALGIPPRHKTYGRGFIEPFGQISSVKQVAPTVLVNYHFSPMAKVEPFVGVGINYTHFTGARSTASGEAASGGPTKIELSDSWGLAAHVGASYAIDKAWSIVGTIAYADVKSDLKATTTTASGDVVRTTHIKFNPVAYTLCVGYSF